MGQQEVDDCALVDLVALGWQHAALPEGARHIDLLTEVVHRLLEQFELIHVSCCCLLALLGSGRRNGRMGGRCVSYGWIGGRKDGYKGGV